MYIEMTSWRWLSVAAPNAAPIAGSAGTIASIASAFSAISPAISTTNSRKPGRGWEMSTGEAGECMGRLRAQVAAGGQVPIAAARDYEERMTDAYEWRGRVG